MHTAPPPKDALENWLNDYPSEKVKGYGHLLLEEKVETDPAFAKELIDYFESAHLDARKCFHKLARISIHPDAGDEACDAQYPGSLPLTALKGLFGEVMCGMMAENFEFVGKHEYLIPVSVPLGLEQGPLADFGYAASPSTKLQPLPITAIPA